MTIAAILVNDAALDLADVEYNVQITHGRSDIKSTPEPGTAAITLRGSTGTGIQIGDELSIAAYSGVCRFLGNVTDLAVEHLSSDPPIPITRVTAIGYLAKLGTLTTGETAYDQETPRDRVDAVMTPTGLSYLNAADDDLELAANNDPDIQPILSYLATLAAASYSRTTATEASQATRASGKTCPRRGVNTRRPGRRSPPTTPPTSSPATPSPGHPRGRKTCKPSSTTSKSSTGPTTSTTSRTPHPSPTTAAANTTS